MVLKMFTNICINIWKQIICKYIFLVLPTSQMYPVRLANVPPGVHVPQVGNPLL